MQLTPRYLVNNRTTIVTNEAGFITEYKPVYQRQLNVYKGIDNVLDFKVLNADQKPINIASYTPKFQAFDENNLLVIEHDGTIIAGDDSAASRGLFKVTVSDNDLLNIDQQYLSYNIHLVDTTTEAHLLTYSNTNFGMNGSIYVSGEAFPGPSPTGSVTTFTADNNQWNSESLNAQPGINGNEALHTAAVYTSSYIGNVVVQATLENQITDSTQWSNIDTLIFDGTETTPITINFNGVFSYIRFVTSANPADKITKIIVRN
jgi:hypothetical protein|tara:strand:+ start:691 stop:1473 length:783 start_codon:yes stop_codon:yes gene_type:complete